ncbi:MAG TPA: SRPBCC family protein [Euzebyales bacterium]|nr:SRPBCC family protein [Euzebyales bacterium]
MELTHSFTVPVGVDQAFEVLTDVERIAPCMPGATIESVDGREFTGRVKVKVGPMQITYRGKARYEELDAEKHTAVIDARGQETRGSGTANATVTATLTEKGEETEVTVVSNLSVTGRPAQFGRGVMNEVGAKLLGQFADCLSQRLSGGDQDDEDDEDTTELTAPASAAASNGSSAAVSERDMTQAAGAASPQPASGAEAAAAAAPPLSDAPSEARQPSAARAPRDTYAPPQDDAIDLFDVAGPSIAKRVAPVLVALLVLLLIWRRRRS